MTTPATTAVAPVPAKPCADNGHVAALPMGIAYPASLLITTTHQRPPPAMSVRLLR